ncbi:hypothetical protein D0Z70_06310 [Sphingobium terrigena]|uniref:SDR family NAD(P)-dependent oxidoreductase n=1 Tax=Sphingobium terrigena TaxID=2304063 RepID=A0A418YVP3_9SPHN|nr:hypothetical protein [Sphingobium terrigena]RJG56259.1 hypothetical protein D0Z70_06310 [Sphingobium terrigena]
MAGSHAGKCALVTGVSSGIGEVAGLALSDDIAQAILFITSLPARANVSQILIRPTADTVAMQADPDRL